MEEELEALLFEGRDVDDVPPRGQYTLLYKACLEGGQAKLVARLIELRADVNWRSGTRNSCLHQAAWKNDLDICSMLIQAGAEVDARGHRDYTPLHYAVLQAHSRIQTLLMDHGADPFARFAESGTPAECEKREGDADAIRNWVLDGNWSPARHQLVREYHPEIHQRVMMLLLVQKRLCQQLHRDVLPRIIKYLVSRS